MSLEQFSQAHRSTIIITILCIAAVLRLAFLSHGQVLGDEPLYSVRSIGWVDTLGSILQTTPLQWFETPPWWTKLSFHDHPPLTFAINHIFFKLFGDTIFVSRLASALFGVANVLLIYVIAKKILQKETPSLLASALFAANDFAIFFARTAMMESLTMFFILLALFLFLKSLDSPSFLPWFGVALGLSILAKYVALVTLPLYFLVFLFFRRSWLKQSSFYLALALFFIVISPVVTYNIYLYQTVHHFDLQLAFLFGQDTPEWQELIGKEQRGDIMKRIRDTAAFIFYISPLISLLSIAGFLLGCVQIARTKEKTPQDVTLLLLTCGYALFPLLVGGLGRFLYYLLPFVVLFAAWFLVNIIPQTSKWAAPVYSIVLLYEVFFGANTTVVAATRPPLGWTNVTYTSRLVLEDYAMAELDNYLDVRLLPYHSGLQPETNIPTINKVIAASLERTKDRPTQRILLAYDNRFDIRVMLWTFARRSFYEGWPVKAVGDSVSFLETLYPDTRVYYVQSMSGAPRKSNPSRFDFEALGASFETDYWPTVIYNNDGDPVFKIFELPLSVFKEQVSSLAL
ncbi:MAG: hypothetical protein A3J66_01725 [Candidatus Magasanikbacteria bacterium RIFCSPHIGHO2_02_FULL_47_14]|uniref:Glycosyltransferase RgtA/B/C/D-like domain-containing protein n=1 Tax=Candidatus Magasanikbacteria bacterium RIFCSPHIGHO2_02_FULL_47_14 TaxID=1798680 RepID=A0A1F6MA20_9BACT|nr:MAG: hypothetical protein A3J66_01725 [Candidatus Magasanikbacteria bacterium RIFCSPHIGHO2_02_FULL_47_14]